MKEFLAEIGIDASLTIAGLIGAVAGTSGSKKPLLARLGSIVMGMGAAIYCTPLACDFLEIVNEKSKLGVAVALGYLGIQGIQKLIISKLNKDGDS